MIPWEVKTATSSGETPRSAKVLLVAYESCADGTGSLISLLTDDNVSRLDPEPAFESVGPSSVSRASLVVYVNNVGFRPTIKERRGTT